MRVKPLAFDSLGARSTSTYVETRDINLIIDPAVALAPKRYGLPPHELEIKRMYELADKIYSLGRDSEVIIITHYHYDHHDPGRIIPLDMFRGKEVYIKDYSKNINISQKIRAHRFMKLISNLVRKVVIADSRLVKVGKTEIEFSEPLPHGSNDRLGYVLSVYLRAGDQSLIYTSDVEGFPLDKQLKFVIDRRPQIIIADGPSTYLEGYKIQRSEIESSIRNLTRLLREYKPEYLILDHHLVRDLMFKDKLRAVYELAKGRGVNVVTAAEYLGRENVFLEANRFKLWGKEKVS